MTPIQILGSIFLLFTLSHVLLSWWRKRLLSMNELLLWFFVFGGILIVILFPQISNRLAIFLGITRGADVIIYGSIVLLFYMMFRIYIQLENIEHKLTILVREIALIQSEVPSLHIDKRKK